MILEFVKPHLEFLGLLHQRTSTSKCAFRSYLRSSLVFVALGIFTVPTFCFLLFEAVTFADYVNSFFFTTCGLLGISFNAVFLWEKSNVNRLIGDLEDTFKQRRNFCLSRHGFSIFFTFFQLFQIELRRSAKCNPKKSLWRRQRCAWIEDEINSYNNVARISSSHCASVYIGVIRSVYYIGFLKWFISLDLSLCVSLDIFSGWRSSRKNTFLK